MKTHEEWFCIVLLNLNLVSELNTHVLSSEWNSMNSESLLVIQIYLSFYLLIPQLSRQSQMCVSVDLLNVSLKSEFQGKLLQSQQEIALEAKNRCFCFYFFLLVLILFYELQFFLDLLKMKLFSSCILQKLPLQVTAGGFVSDPGRCNLFFLSFCFPS